MLQSPGSTPKLNKTKKKFEYSVLNKWKTRLNNVSHYASVRRVLTKKWECMAQTQHTDEVFAPTILEGAINQKQSPNSIQCVWPVIRKNWPKPLFFLRMLYCWVIRLLKIKFSKYSSKFKISKEKQYGYAKTLVPLAWQANPWAFGKHLGNWLIRHQS